MKNIKNIIFAIAISTVLLTTACQQPGGDVTGSEFMPEMAHSVAYEANVLTEYSFNTFNEESVASRRVLSQPRLPVNGTMPRGYAGMAATGRTFNSAEDAVKYTLEMMDKYGEDVFAPNGYVPYYFEDSDTGRAQATSELLYNPFPITAEGIANGKELYNIYCGICHGEKGDGEGYLASDDNPNKKFLAVPKNLLLPEYIESSNGRYYHSIMYGINVMGGYSDKLSYEERWQVIHYIRSLQAKEAKLAYSETENTLNPEFGVPYASLEDWALAMNSSGDDNDNDGEGHQEEEGTEEGNHDGDNDGDDDGAGHSSGSDH